MVGQAGTLAEACGLLQGVDIAVIDLVLPDGNGVQLILATQQRERDREALAAASRLTPLRVAADGPLDHGAENGAE